LTIHTALNITAPMGLASDVPGNLFVSDAVGQVVWKVSLSNQVTLLAGSLGNAGSADGKGSAAQFNNPGGVAVDAAGNVLVADTGNHTLRRITPDGTVTTVAGSPGLTGTADGLGALARFNTPTGLAMSSTGAVYVSDSLNHTIRILGVDGTVSTYAGTPGQAGFNDGNARSALFDQPNGLALAANGTLYVADYGNSCLRTISPSLVVSTLAGKFNNPGFFDATGTAAQFNRPVGIALDAAGNLWVADTQNHAIRRILPSGVVNLMAGTGAAGNADGTGTTALFDLPCGILYTPGGNLLVADTANHILRSVTPVGIVTTLTVP
jgi:sugar lactone lactonase YvrE